MSSWSVTQRDSVELLLRMELRDPSFLEKKLQDSSFVIFKENRLCSKNCRNAGMPMATSWIIIDASYVTVGCGIKCAEMRPFGPCTTLLIQIEIHFWSNFAIAKTKRRDRK